MAPYQNTIPGLTTLTTFTTAKLIKEQPAVVNDFAAAMKETLAVGEGPGQQRGGAPGAQGQHDAAAAGGG